MWRACIAGVAGAILGLAGEAAVHADVFLLTSGGRLEGTLANPDESPREKYVVQLAGGQVTLARSQVTQWLRPRPAEVEYERVHATYPDTPEGQWKLAAWCLEQGLIAQRKTHLERILVLDPEHAEARRALGYIKSNGRWTTQEELMKSQGFLRYRGRWRLPQEVEVIQAKERTEKAEKEWAQKLDRWHNNLGTDRDSVARDGIHAIADPTAVKPLAQLLKREAPDKVRLLYVDALARIGVPEALQALAVCALHDASEEVRLSCVDLLGKTKSHEVVAYFVGQLKSKDNGIVNRAAVGLARMGDHSAVLPLIEALWTTHKFKIVTGSGGANSMSTTFSSTGGGGMSMGGGPKIIKKELQNQTVLDALVMLTGANFGFDVRAWKAWYASQKQHNALDTRRN
jgi:hypothetical protein